MTEVEWLSCSDPERMLAYLSVNEKVNPRQLRLFALGCCRRVWPSPEDPRCREAIEVAEGMVEGMIDEEELSLVDEGVGDAWGDACTVENAPLRWTTEAAGTLHLTHMDSWVAAVQTARFAAAFWPDDAWRFAVETDTDPWEVLPQPQAESLAWLERKAQAALLRDLVGNPFR